jgi:hypothetical protein
MRWSEEVVLLQEEMRHVLAYNTWHADWWEEQVGCGANMQAPYLEGMVAYARRQAHLFRTMHDDCQRYWKDTARYAAIGYSTDNLILTVTSSPLST